MKIKQKISQVAISAIASILLLGCGSSESTTQTPTEDSNSNIVGSIIKGPISSATINIKDAQGNLLSSTESKDGLFSFAPLTLTSEYYVIESFGGSYSDEATDTTVNIGATKGLKTLLSREKLEMILTNKEYIAITPETTIFTALVLNDINNSTLATSTSNAEALIYASMIKNSSPMPNLEGDKFLQVGNFTTAIPKNASESFARNRAVSFSYMVRDLNLSAESAFDVLDLIIEDYKDGQADGITLADSRDINVSEEFALSRTKLFQDTTSKLRNGELSEAQIAELSAMGFDTNSFSNTATSADANLTAQTNLYLASNSLPSLHILPLLSDEDSNTTDTKETYTLTANTNVDVEIQTPEGNWTTPMWRYNNNPLPVVIRTSRGNEMTLNLNNKLDSNSTIHWHGFKIPAIMDGGPDVPVEADASKAYKFTMNQPAAPLWFHPHPDMETGKQVYMGLAGVYLLEDSISKKLELDKNLPSGEKDTVLLVQDRRFDGKASDARRNLLYMNKSMDSDGMLGDTILVNGSVLPKQEVSNTKHRYRLYNVSNARNYDFALSDGSSFTIVGTDGGLLKNPVSVNHITLGAAQRVEIVIDFTKYSVGEKVMLISKPFNGDMMSMMDMGSMNSSNSSNSTDEMGGMNGMNNMNGMNGTSSTNNMNNSNSTTEMSSMGNTGNGVGLNIMRFDITTQENEDITLYTELPVEAEITTRLTEDDAVNKGNERVFVMSMDMSAGMGNMSFVINGKAFKADRVDEFVPTDATEIWSIRNMSPMAHPFHAHAIQYQILTRDGVAASGVDLGWKDTFLVQPGETVRVIGNFTSAEGDYMYHCHILEHEDAGMMGYFRVGNSGNIDNLAVQTAP